MRPWTVIRDAVLAATGTVGRQVALALVTAVQRARAHHERVHLVGTWREVFDALGLRNPRGEPWSDKAARAALQLLADASGGAVARITSHTWRVVSEAIDALDPGQLELLFDDPGDPNGKAESAPGKPTAAPRPAARPSPRTRARASWLERAFGREPIAAAARGLGRLALGQLGVHDLGQLEACQLWSITLTAADVAELEPAARRWAEGLDVELVPERSPCGRLHYHGLLLATPEQAATLLQRWVDEGGGIFDRRAIRDVQRLRFWISYMYKHPAYDLEVLARGAFGTGAPEPPPPAARRPDPPPTEGRSRRPSVERRAWEWMAAAWRRWGTR